jgi:hypothetical protein
MPERGENQFRLFSAVFLGGYKKIYVGEVFKRTGKV